MVNVICMKWGDKYGPAYVNRLYGMVARNLTRPFRFTCFTDNRDGVRPEVRIQPLPSLDLPSGLPERGWMKLATFQPDLGGLEGQTLFLDLDVVIVDSIDCFFDYKAEFAIAFDQQKEKERIGNSSVYRFEIGKYPDVLDYFRENFDRIREQFRNEQAYLSDRMNRKGVLKFWPREWCPSFKYHCLPPFPLNFWQEPQIPDGARIILFHGLPEPDAAARGESGKWYRHFRPARWIGEYWRE
ncbi:MAG: hypothetical protein PVF23_05525 [Chromatiales bacterium]